MLRHTIGNILRYFYDITAAKGGPSQSSFIPPAQLYNDLQETFRDKYVCVAKLKYADPTKPVMLKEMANDSIEKFFSMLRATHNSGMLDSLDKIR